MTSTMKSAPPPYWPSPTPSSSTTSYFPRPAPPVPTRSSPAPQPLRVSVLFDYEGPTEGDLILREGDVVNVLERPSEEWWVGYLEKEPGVAGAFPRNHVEIIRDFGATIRPSSPYHTRPTPIPRHSTSYPSTPTPPSSRAITAPCHPPFPAIHILSTSSTSLSPSPLSNTPLFPLCPPLPTHDVLPSDWDAFLTGLDGVTRMTGGGRVVSGTLRGMRYVPLPLLGLAVRAGDGWMRQVKMGAGVRFVEGWNEAFFRPRGLDVYIAQGSTRISGPIFFPSSHTHTPSSSSSQPSPTSQSTSLSNQLSSNPFSSDIKSLQNLYKSSVQKQQNQKRVNWGYGVTEMSEQQRERGNGRQDSGAVGDEARIIMGPGAAKNKVTAYRLVIECL